MTEARTVVEDKHHVLGSLHLVQLPLQRFTVSVVEVLDVISTDLLGV
jgi:hypothetical protein